MTDQPAHGDTWFDARWRPARRDELASYVIETSAGGALAAVYPTSPGAAARVAAALRGDHDHALRDARLARLERTITAVIRNLQAVSQHDPDDRRMAGEIHQAAMTAADDLNYALKEPM